MAETDARAADVRPDVVDGNGAGNSTQVLTDGLMSLFGPAVQAAENGAASVQRSQRELNAQLDAVNLELERFANCCSAPPLAQHMARLSDLRQRMTTLNNSLTTLQDRLERLYVITVPGARIGALGAAFHAARTPARQPVLRDEVPLSDPILPLPERVAPLMPPRSPRASQTAVMSTNVVPGTPSHALAKLHGSTSSHSTSASSPSSPPSSLTSFVSSAQHYESAMSLSPLPPSVLDPSLPGPPRTPPPPSAAEGEL